MKLHPQFFRRCLSDLILWICLSLLLYNHKGFDLGDTWMAWVIFPTFFNLSLNFLIRSHDMSRRRQWHPTPVLLPGKSHGQWSLVGCSPCGRTWLSDFIFTFHFHALEKEMATHSSVLAWRIPGTGDPGGLPSLGSHRVGHHWSDLAAAAAVVFVKLKIACSLEEKLWPT